MLNVGERGLLAPGLQQLSNEIRRRVTQEAVQNHVVGGVVVVGVAVSMVAGKGVPFTAPTVAQVTAIAPSTAGGVAHGSHVASPRK